MEIKSTIPSLCHPRKGAPTPFSSFFKILLYVHRNNEAYQEREAQDVRLQSTFTQLLNSVEHRRPLPVSFVGAAIRVTSARLLPLPQVGKHFSFTSRTNPSSPRALLSHFRRPESLAGPKLEPCRGKCAPLKRVAASQESGRGVPTARNTRAFTASHRPLTATRYSLVGAEKEPER